MSESTNIKRSPEIKTAGAAPKDNSNTTQNLASKVTKKAFANLKHKREVAQTLSGTLPEPNRGEGSSRKPGVPHAHVTAPTGLGEAYVRIHSPGHRYHGRLANVFHRFDDGRVNVRMLNQRGRIERNLTLKPGEYKEQVHQTNEAFYTNRKSWHEDMREHGATEFEETKTRIIAKKPNGDILGAWSIDDDHGITGLGTNIQAEKNVKEARETELIANRELEDTIKTKKNEKSSGMSDYYAHNRKKVGIKEDAPAMSAGAPGDPGAVQNPTSNYAAQLALNKNKFQKKVKTKMYRRKSPLSEETVKEVTPDKHTIYIMRHGKTALDDIHRSDGWLDFPLSDEGRMGLINAQQYLKDKPITKIFAPTLKRTTETAHLLKSGLLTNPDIVPADDARTWHLGTLMGSKKKPNKPIVKYFMNHATETPTGGESFDSFKNRFNSWIADRQKEVDDDQGPYLVVLSGSNLRELGLKLYGDTNVLDMDEGGLAALSKVDGKWHGNVIFGHKDDDGDWTS